MYRVVRSTGIPLSELDELPMEEVELYKRIELARQLHFEERLTKVGQAKSAEVQTVNLLRLLLEHRIGL